MELKEGDHVLGMWFLECSDKNWQCVVYRRDGKLLGEYRFRYFSEHSRDPFDGADEKSSYSLEAKHGDWPKAKATIDRLVEFMRGHWDVVVEDYFDVDGSPEELVRILLTKPYANAKVVKPETAN